MSFEFRRSCEECIYLADACQIYVYDLMTEKLELLRKFNYELVKNPEYLVFNDE